MLLQYRPEVDGLRAVAVLGVLLFHFELFGLGGGFTGVDIFFVISGFLITQIIQTELNNHTFSLRSFYIRRIRRLFPALCLIWGLTLIFGFLLFTPGHYTRLSEALFSSILSVSNLFFWHEAGYFDTSANFKPLLHTWSLSVEEQFYLVWPITLIGLSRFKKTGKSFTVIIITGLLSLIFAEKWLDIDPSAAFYLTPFRIIEFVLGALLSLVIQHRPRQKLILEPFMILGLSCILYSFFLYSETTPFPGLYSLLPTVGAALVIYCGGDTYSGLIVRNPVAVRVGLISYSLYLVHWPLLIFYKYWHYKDIELSEKYLLFFTSFIIAYLSYRFIEIPFRKGKNDLNQLKFISICILLFLMFIALSGIVYVYNGFPGRVNTCFVEFVKESKGFHEKYFGGKGFFFEQTIGEKRKKGEPFEGVLLGDSFANQYASGLDHLLKKEHVTIKNMTINACIMGPGVNSFINGKVQPHCNAAYNKALSYLQGNNKPLILSQAWEYYYQSVCDLEGNIFQFPNHNKYYTFMLDHVRKIREEIGPDRDLIILGNPPGSGNADGVQTCVERPGYLPNDCLTSLTYSREKGLGYTINEMLAEYAKEAKRTYFLNPYDVLCDRVNCYTVDNEHKHTWYSDQAHISIYGSSRVVNYFSRDFVRILKPGQQIPRGN